MTDELLVPRGVALDDAAAALHGRFAVRERASRTRDIVFLDTFDARSRAAGLRVAHESGRLTVTPGGSTALRRPTRPFGLDALPAGAARDALVPVVGVRALRPLARVFARERMFAVLDEEEKTVARISLLAPALSDADGGLVLLRGRVRLEGLRGYGRELDTLRAELVGELGFVPAEEPLADAAVRAGGGDPAGFTGGLGSVVLAPGEAAGTAVAAVLGAVWYVVEGNVDGVLGDTDIEHLHDLRVAVRRARSVLRELRGVVAPDALAPLRDELRWLQAATGPLRDLDIALLDFGALTGFVWSPELVGEFDPLRRVLERRRRRAFLAVRRVLRSDRFRALATASRVAMDGPDASEPIDTLAGARIRSRYQRMVRTGRAIDDSSPPDALHDLRKQGKELRYLLELFGALFETASVRPLVRTLKALQDTLGRFQDRSVQVALVRSLATEAGSEEPAAVLAAGALIERLHEDELAARREFAERFPGFAARDARRCVRESFV